MFGRKIISSLCLAGSLLVLPSCQALEDLILPPSEEELLEREIELERRKAELERLKNANNPTPAPTSPTETTPDPNAPVSTNQNPQIKTLDSVLASTVKNNDTVRILIEASDADGDTLEYTWSSVYNGLSSTRGQEVVWYPADQNLAGKTNIITVTVTDKKGGASTASLNILIQNDGSLLVREDTANLPLLRSIQALKTTEGDIIFRSVGSDPAGGILRYRWEASQGKFTTPEAASSLWQAGNSSGDIEVKVTLINQQNLQASGSFKFKRQANGELVGSFSGTPVSYTVEQAQVTGLVTPGLETFVGRALIFKGEELFIWDPRTSKRTQITTLSDLKAARENVNLQYRGLVYQAPSDSAWLILQQSVAYNPAANGYAVYRIDLNTSTAQFEYFTPSNFQSEFGQADIDLTAVGERQGELVSIIRSRATTGHKIHLGRLRDQALLYELRADIGYKLISPSGLLIGDKTTSENRVYNTAYYAIHPETGEETLLADSQTDSTIASMFNQPGWSHQGDRLVGSPSGVDNSYRGFNNGVATLDLKSKKLTPVLENKLQMNFDNLRWSLDDLYLTFVEYPYKYISDPTQNFNTGYLTIMNPEFPEERIKTEMAFSNREAHMMFWVP